MIKVAKVASHSENWETNFSRIASATGLPSRTSCRFTLIHPFFRNKEKTSPYKKDCNSFLQEDCCSLIRIHLILFYYKEHHCDNALPEPNRYSIPFIEGRPWRRGLLEADSAANGQELKPAL